MSSNIKVAKICEMCSKEFAAKKTTSKTCSDSCAKRIMTMQKTRSLLNLALLSEISAVIPFLHVTFILILKQRHSFHPNVLKYNYRIKITLPLRVNVLSLQDISAKYT